MVPAGILDVGKGVDFLVWEGCEEIPWAAGEGERGVEKGWAAPVEVAVGGPAVRGEEGGDVGGVEERSAVCEKRRIGWVRGMDRRVRQREQIILREDWRRGGDMLG